MRSRWITGWVLALASCGSPRSPSAPASAKPELLSPADLLPNDLDFVIRVDSERVGQIPVFAEAARELAKTNTSPLLRAVAPAVGGSSAIFVGGRLMADGFRGDGVVAIEQGVSADDKRQAAPVGPAFRPLADSPPHTSVFERPAAERDEPVLEVVLETRGLVLATPAEADAVLRVLRAGPDRDRLVPPVRGLVSFAGKVRGTRGPAGLSSVWQGLADGLVQYMGSVEADDAFRVEADLTYASAAQAESAVKAASGKVERLGLFGPAFRSMADSVRLTQNGQAIRVRATVPFAIVATLH
ncbi:MAG TPA: hypothetical protein VF881_13790 [Polyangiaceae bacterium]